MLRPIEAIFVYGTLKPGEAYYPRYCRSHTTAIIPARVQGCLYHLPQGYPALTLGEGWVQGVLLRLTPGTDLSDMDQFEGHNPAYEPAQNEYQRLTWPIMDLTGQSLEQAWVYVMADSRVNRYGGIWIPTGFWSRTRWPSISPPRF